MKPCKTQCAQCPFRKKALPGWLGDYYPRSVNEAAWKNMPFFCHPTINYNDRDWKKKALKSGQLCLGILVYANRMHAPLHTDEPGSSVQVIKARKWVQKNIRDSKLDVMNPIEFGKHHELAGKRNDPFINPEVMQKIQDEYLAAKMLGMDSEEED